jgi:hypothetical protein
MFPNIELHYYFHLQLLLIRENNPLSGLEEHQFLNLTMAQRGVEFNLRKMEVLQISLPQGLLLGQLQSLLLQSSM